MVMMRLFIVMKIFYPISLNPNPGLWFLGLDGCNYEGRFPDLTLTDGWIAAETITWLNEKLAIAQGMNITVIAFMHHGVVEHFHGMETVFPEYLIDGWIDFSQYLLDHGVQIVFTGHHHANDISVIDNSSDKLYDIQTGSLVTWPSIHRYVNYNMRSKVLRIDNRVVRKTSFAGWNFQSYAYNFLLTGILDLVIGYLQLLHVPYEQAIILQPLVTLILMAYYQGNEYEMSNPEIMAGIIQLIDSGDPLAVNFGYLLLGIWNDETPDNDVMLRLRKNILMEKNY